MFIGCTADSQLVDGTLKISHIAVSVFERLTNWGSRTLLPRYCRYSCTAACRSWTRSVEYTNSGSECTFSHMSLPHPPLNFGRVRVLKGAHLPWQHLFFQLGSTRVRLCVLCVVKFATVYLHPIEHSVIASKCMCVCTMFYVHVSQIFSVHVIDACCTI